MKLFAHIQQQDEKGCGVACMAMILNYYKTEISIHKLRDFSGINLEGTSVFGLKKRSKSYFLIVLLSKLIMMCEKDKELPLPLIAHILIENSYMH